MDQSIYFVSFGAPSNWYGALNRIKTQAESFKIFKKIFTYTDVDLKNDINFWNKHEKFILSNSRGYGYWVWKPYVILKVLDQMNDNDILLSCDSGCELNIDGIDYFNTLIEKTNNKLIIGTSCGSDDYRYTKMDTINYFNMHDEQLLRTTQMQSGCIMLKKCETIVRLINEWYDIVSNNYNLIDDTQSIAPNNNEFIENRHDQSILSMLVKKYKLINYDIDPTNWTDWNNSQNTKNNYLTKGIKYPIWTSRNRSELSIKQL